MKPAPVAKLDPGRWDSVADLARWLLTHADEYEVAILTLRGKRRQVGDPETDLDIMVCPQMTVVEAVGLIEVGKIIVLDRSRENDPDLWSADPA